MPTDSNLVTSDPEGVTWLWERKPDSVDLEKVLVPVGWLPEGALPWLQIRYHPGDKVNFDYGDNDFDHHGTVVQDQGLHVAIAGDSPSISGFTIHKFNTRPLTGPPAPSPELTVSASTDPRDRPVVRYDGYTATACWHPTTANESGWRRQPRLHVTYHQGRETGFIATLHSVDERHQDGRNYHATSVDSIVVHYEFVPRPSQRALRTCLRSALDVVCHPAAQSEPAVLAHFVTIGQERQSLPSERK